LQEGFPVEFFIEGGRSRTGKMVMPKYGLLSMVIQAFRESYYDDLAIIPVFIGYDRVIEEKAYLKELEGGTKVKEKASALIKNRKILKKRYGSVYLNIGEPIMLKEYLDSQEKYIGDMTINERRSLYRKMGYDIADRINKISVVTPFSLVAMGLLGHYKRGISHNDLMHLLDEFCAYLDHRKVRFSYSLANRAKAFTDSLDLFESSGFLSKMGVEEDDEEEFEEIVYSIEGEEKRLALEYYKNNIMHFFVSLSFIATSILSHESDEISLARIIEDYRFFKRLFWHEFIFDDKIDDVEEINEVLNYIHDKGMIVGHEGDEQEWIEVKGKGRMTLMPFASLINNYIESYWVAIRGCTYLKNKGQMEKDLIRKIHKLGMKMYKKGEISRVEALSQPNYKNALDFLDDAGIVAVSYGKSEDHKKKGKEDEEKMYTLTSKRGRLESLRRQLFRFMG
jgi:glycerol-3-phosphate O-acyltransferase